jgi:hypothetical protein
MTLRHGFALVFVFMLAMASVSHAQRQGGGAPGGGNAGQGRQGGVGPFGRGGFNREPVVGTATIRGRVIALDTGAPIRRAQVRAQGVGPPRLASTDGNGSFELRDMPAGRWTLTASKAGFVSRRLGQTHPFESVPPLEISDGQRLDRADFILPRGSAITGRVYDEFGDPVAGARVQVMRYQMIRGRRQLSSTGVVDQTDDTGSYRLYGLSPGEYYVSGSLRGALLDTAADDGTSYAPTYYPGTGSVSEAQRVMVGTGEELPGINFALLPVRTVRISGVVIDSSGMPLNNGVITLNNDSDFEGGPFANAGRIRPDGGFTISNVTPGSYTLLATAGPRRENNNANAQTEPEVAYVPITIGQEDINGLAVTTTRGGSVAGTIVAERGTGTLQPNSIVVRAQPFRAGPGLNGRNAQANASGAFSLTGLVGPEVISVERVPTDWMVKSIEISGTDVTDRALEFRGNERVTDARITLTNRMTEVNGTVAARQQSTNGYSIVIFPEDPAKWTFPSRYLRSTRTDEQGAFKIRALPPERYLALAVDYVEDGEASDPQFLERMKTSATPFTLREGDTKTVELKLLTR